jgi:hypothetical protein
MKCLATRLTQPSGTQTGSGFIHTIAPAKEVRCTITSVPTAFPCDSLRETDPVAARRRVGRNARESRVTVVFISVNAVVVAGSARVQTFSSGQTQKRIPRIRPSPVFIAAKRHSFDEVFCNLGVDVHSTDICAARQRSDGETACVQEAVVWRVLAGDVSTTTLCRFVNSYHHSVTHPRVELGNDVGCVFCAVLRSARIGNRPRVGARRDLIYNTVSTSKNCCTTSVRSQSVTSKVCELHPAEKANDECSKEKPVPRHERCIANGRPARCARVSLKPNGWRLRHARRRVWSLAHVSA